MTRLDLLNELQTLDIRIDENLRARRELEADLANDSSVAAARDQFKAAAGLAEELRARLRSLELEAKGIDDHIKQVDARLYGGQVTNPKELSGLERDSQMLKRRKSELEDRMLEVMGELEMRETAASEQRRVLDRVAATRSDATVRDQARIEELEATASKLEAARAQLRSRISPADLQLYDELVRAKRGRAVARIKGDACSACGFGVPSGVASRARLGELSFCTNCGRILVP